MFIPVFPFISVTAIGAKVSNTIRKGIVDTDRFMEVDNGASVLMAGQVAALGGRSYCFDFLWFQKIFKFDLN